MTDDNSDTTVEQLKKELKKQRDRVAELESHVYPTRRDVMAAAVGAVGISALTGTASAAPNYGNATGSVGTDSEPLNDVISKNGTFQSVSAERIGSERHYAEAYSGADPDARLDNALSAASSGDVIYLGNATYESAHTIDTELTVIGTVTPGSTNGTTITSDWTISTRMSFKHVVFNTDFTIEATRVGLFNCTLQGTNTVTVNGNRCACIGCMFGNFTFASGTSSGIADSNRLVTVTDNGSNTVGDIS